MNKNDIKKYLFDAVGKAVEKHINGHLREIKDHLFEQDVKIDGLLKSTREVIETYNTSKGFFTTLKKVAMFVIPVAGAWAIISKVWK